MSPLRQVALAVAWLVFVLGTCQAIDATSGSTSVGAPLSGGALPAAVDGTDPSSVDTSASTRATTSSAATSTAPARPGVPVAVDIPFASTHYPHGVHASVVSHPLNADGSLFVPDDPHTVSWASQDAAPGSSRGTVILTSHVNFVIGGNTVVGAFADLADYARDAVGRRLSVRLADGRQLRYQVVAGREYSKEQLAADPALRTELYNQTAAYGAPGAPRSSRLLLVSCGGPFDNATGEYEDNVFLYALPVAAAPRG